MKKKFVKPDFVFCQVYLKKFSSKHQLSSSFFWGGGFFETAKR